MAVVETWIKTDLKKTVKVHSIGGNLFSQDNMGNLIGVEILSDGQVAEVSGTVSANALRADGATVAVTGTLTGNKASVTLPQAAYAIPGMLSVVIKLTSGSTVTTIGAIQAIVYRSSTDTAVDPGTIIPSVQDLIARIDAAVASIPPDYSALSNQVSTNTTDISGLKTATSDLPTMRTNIAANTEDVSSLKSAIQTKAPVIIGSASGSIATFSDGADDMPVKELTVQIEPVQAGSGDPSPDNVRPISGWTGAKVMRTGKNLFNKFPQRTETINGVTFTRNADGSVQITGTASGAAYFNYYSWVEFANTPFYALKGKTVRLVGGNSNIRFTISYRKNSSSAASDTNDTGNHPTITLPTDGTFQLYVALRVLGGVTVNETIVPMLLSPDELDTTPELYQGETYDIAFPTSAGTVYGGTLDAVTGELVVDMINVDLGDFTWEMRSDSVGNYFRASLSPVAKRKAGVELGNNICSVYPITPSSAVIDKSLALSNPGDSIFVRDTDYPDATAFKTAMSGVQLVYEIATPITYQTTPQEISTLLGQNNICADTGDVSITYPADTKLYIDNKIAELQALVLENISNS